jgi:hypothetical protein
VQMDEGPSHSATVKVQAMRLRQERATKTPRMRLDRGSEQRRRKSRRERYGSLIGAARARSQTPPTSLRVSGTMFIQTVTDCDASVTGSPPPVPGKPLLPGAASPFPVDPRLPIDSRLVALVLTRGVAGCKVRPLPMLGGTIRPFRSISRPHTVRLQIFSERRFQHSHDS